MVTIKEVLDDGVRALVVGRADEERVCELADTVRGMHLRSGDTMRLDPRCQPAAREAARDPRSRTCCSKRCPTSPTTTSAASTTRSSRSPTPSSCPFLHQDLFAEHRLPAPKGILLYGPPGCGKTLIAKAVANSLAKKVAAATGDEKGRSYFINIKGPELLNKYVGETERQIRLVFQRAREKSEEGWPVIVFFDEMDSMFRTRGSGISSDMESTIVPQLLAEIDGVEGLRNVIVIGATNREDLIDPAILRPGRLDVKIKIERPNAGGGDADLRPLPHRRDPDRRRRVGAGDDRHHRRRDVPRRRGQPVPRGHLRQRRQGDPLLQGLRVGGDDREHRPPGQEAGDQAGDRRRRPRRRAPRTSLASIKQEYKEHEDLPNTTNPDDWAKISGKKGERIVFIRTLVAEAKAEGPTGGRAIERVATGQYL